MAASAYDYRDQYVLDVEVNSPRWKLWLFDALVWCLTRVVDSIQRDVNAR